MRICFWGYNYNSDKNNSNKDIIPKYEPKVNTIHLYTVKNVVRWCLRSGTNWKWKILDFKFKINGPPEQNPKPSIKCQWERLKEQELYKWNF